MHYMTHYFFVYNLFRTMGPVHNESALAASWALDVKREVAAAQ
jgi:hypothetical protein